MIVISTSGPQTQTTVEGASGRLSHHPALDGIRGAAVTGVILFHAGYLTGGYLGVDAFFVLSGFLITSLLLAEARSEAHITLRTFWIRRARRLLPALALVLLAVAAYAWIFAKPDELSSIRLDCWATLGYVANWRQVISSNDYFALFRSPSPLQHTWSLAIEEQFYLVWPIVVMLMVRGVTFARAARRVFVTSATLALVSFVVAQLVYRPSDASRVYYGTDTRAGAILLGAALGAWFATRDTRAPRAAPARPDLLQIASVVATLGLGLAWWRLGGESTILYRGGLIMCGVATTVIIAACIQLPSGLVGRLFSWRPLRELGIISYGIYLWHWPLFLVLSSDRTHLDGLVLLFVRCATTLIVAMLSYRFVERPIRSGAGTARQMIRLVPLTAAVLVVTITAATFDARPAQTLTSKPTSGGVLVVGNSIGINLGFALDRAGLGVSIRSVFGCSLLRGELNIRGGQPAKSCGPYDEWVKAQHPDFVLLMVLGVAGAATTIKVDGTTVPVTSPRFGEMYEDELQREIDTLSATGAIVIVPNLPCMKDVEVPASQVGQFDARLVEENTLLHDVVTRPTNHSRVVSPDLRSFVCPNGNFQHALGNVKDARPDGSHFSPQGADAVVSWLMQQVPSLSRAKRTRTLADDLFYRLTAAGFICTFGSSGTASEQPFVTTASCGYPWLPNHVNAGGSLRVDRRPKQLLAYARTFRANMCARRQTSTPGGSRHDRIGYILQTGWIFTGPGAPIAARKLAMPLTYFTC